MIVLIEIKDIYSPRLEWYLTNSANVDITLDKKFVLRCQKFAESCQKLIAKSMAEEAK